MVRSPPKKPRKNNVPRYLEDSPQAESGGIMTPVIKTSNATTQPPLMVRLLLGNHKVLLMQFNKLLEFSMQITYTGMRML